MRKVAYLLLLMGLLLAAYPTVNHWAQDFRQEQLLRSWEASAASSPQQSEVSNESEAVGSQLNRLFEQTGTGSPTVTPGTPALEQTALPVQESAAAEVSANPKPLAAPIPAKKASTPPQPKVIGLIRIEAIKLKLPIVEGVSAQDMTVAPGHIPGTASPGEVGNAVIAGHRSYTYGRMFNRLEELEAGDQITIESGGRVYEYTVYAMKMVDPTDVSVLNRNNKDKVLTLITCDEEGKRRLILHAKLK